jgi:hypothetical protein
MNDKLRIGLCWFARIIIFGIGTYIVMGIVVVVLFVAALLGIPFKDATDTIEAAKDQYLLYSVAVWTTSTALYWLIDRFFHKPRIRFLFIYVAIVQLLFFLFIGWYFLDSLKECVDPEISLIDSLFLH